MGPGASRRVSWRVWAGLGRVMVHQALYRPAPRLYVAPLPRRPTTQLRCTSPPTRRRARLTYLAPHRIASFPLPTSPPASPPQDLPEYTTDERMRWGLVTAMAYGLGGILNG